LSLRTIFIIITIGLGAFGAYGYANTLISTGYNEIGTIQIVSSHPESLTLLKLGSNPDVTLVELKFVDDGSWPGRVITLNFYDMNDTLIGTGTVVAGSEAPKVTLSDTVTSTERPDLRKITVTAA